jgi:rod shape-determining protein MreD
VRPATQARLRLTALLLLCILLQTTLVPDIRVRRVCPDLMLLVAIGAGLVAGPEYGAIVGFAAGLLTDLFLPTTPLGLSALAYCVTGFAVGALRGSMLREGWLMAPLVTFAGSAAGVVLFVVTGVMVGQSQLTLGGPAVVAKTAALVAAMNTVLAIPVTRIVAWAAGGAAVSSASSSGRQGRADRTALSR